MPYPWLKFWPLGRDLLILHGWWILLFSFNLPQLTSSSPWLQSGSLSHRHFWDIQLQWPPLYQRDVIILIQLTTADLIFNMVTIGFYVTPPLLGFTATVASLISKGGNSSTYHSRPHLHQGCSLVPCHIAIAGIYICKQNKMLYREPGLIHVKHG